MKTLPLALGALLFGAALPVLAENPVGAMHPEESIPANLPRMTSPGPYDGFTRQIQEKLNALGFDAGPANGDFGWKTQAALAQFQLASLLPASGMPDAATLLELGVDPADRFADASGTAESESAAAGSTRP